jgi:hypothetical protein
MYHRLLISYGDIGSGNPSMSMMVLGLSLPILRQILYGAVYCMMFIDCQMVVINEVGIVIPRRHSSIRTEKYTE